MANDSKLDGKLQIGTGDVDKSVTLGNNSSMTTNNNTQIQVENGGTLHYKDAEGIKVEHEQRREDFNNFCNKASEIGQKIHDNTFAGKVEKGFKSFENGMDKICHCKSSRFDEAVNMASSTTNENDTQMSR